MYRGNSKKKNMTVHEFLCFVRKNCQQGCSKCKLRDESVDMAIQKKMCIFSKFDILSDRSLLFILKKTKEISDFKM